MPVKDFKPLTLNSLLSISVTSEGDAIDAPFVLF